MHQELLSSTFDVPELVETPNEESPGIWIKFELPNLPASYPTTSEDKVGPVKVLKCLIQFLMV